MAGPTFSFWYGDFTNTMAAQLELALNSISSRLIRKEYKERLFDAELYVHTSAAIVMSVDRQRGYYTTLAEQEFRKHIGCVPSFELSAYCVAKSDSDWDALRRIAECVASTFGGWFIEAKSDSVLPTLPSSVSVLDDCVHEIVADDHLGFFRDRLSDDAYVSKNRTFVPKERYWVIDATVAPSFWVGK